MGGLISILIDFKTYYAHLPFLCISAPRTPAPCFCKLEKGMDNGEREREQWGNRNNEAMKR